MFHRHRKITIIFTIAMVTIVSLSIITHYLKPNLHYTPNQLKESNSVFTLPYCGFYHLYGYQLSEADKQEAIDWCGQMLTYDSQSIILLQINLCNYSNTSLSRNALEQLDSIFNTFSRANKQIILRFLYDWEGKALETEPDSIEQILSHMEQVAPVVNKYESHIFMLQGVFTGNCGEMNQTHYGTNENIIQLAEKLSGVISKNIFLSVRTPAHLRTITKTGTPLSETEAYDGSLFSRLGLYNDGMLGNDFDCGTYDDTSFANTTDYTEKGTREEEISFQETLCQFVPNGGEAVLVNPFNDLDNAISDLSRMHVSYLSCDHDASVLNKWKDAIYTGKEDDIFNEVSGYDYIAAHLGYRYVLETSDITTSSFLNSKTILSALIKNTGFSPAYRKFQMTFTLKNNVSDTITVPVNYDNRKLLPGQRATITADIKTSALKKGDYTVSLSIVDNATKLSVPFANEQTKSDNTIPCGILTIK